MHMDEKKKAQSPARTESVKRVSNTFMLTFPHSKVVRSRFASFLSSSTFNAALFPDSTSISSFSLLRPNKPRVSPEKIADCVKQKKMPIKRASSMEYFIIIYKVGWALVLNENLAFSNSSPKVLKIISTILNFFKINCECENNRT